MFWPPSGGLLSGVPSGALRSPNSRSYEPRSTTWPCSRPRALAPGPHQRPGGSPPASPSPVESRPAGLALAEEEVVRAPLNVLVVLEAEGPGAWAPPAAGRFPAGFAGLDVV